MVRAVKAFACEWCGISSFRREADARRHERDCVKGVNRAELVGRLEVHIEQQPRESAGTRVMLAADFAFRRLALYDRMAKEHGAGQEKPDGEA